MHLIKNFGVAIVVEKKLAIATPSLRFIRGNFPFFVKPKIMKTILLTLASFALGISLPGQSQMDLDTLMFTTSSDMARQIANEHVAKGIVYLPLQSGEGPITYPADRPFEKRYQVKFFEFGCIGPLEEVMVAYSEVVFEYLNRQYGPEWQDQIRDDVIGFRQWKKRQKNDSTSKSNN